jgi:hypothetical protein
MSALGLHLALSDDELRVLRSLPDEDKADHIAEDLEAAKIDTPDGCQTDKSWAYIHAAFNGTDPDGPLDMAPSPPPLSFFQRLFGRQREVSAAAAGAERLAIVGSEALLSTDDYYIGLIPSDGVGSVADALERISEEELQQRVRHVHGEFEASGSADDAADYAGGWYPGLQAFFRHAADSGKHVIFTVDF